ncbi:MAG: hypothetical protein LBI34_03050 [Puniceicoccales bacterium]|jgi:hypothetical protein|nr:hypothetical protein [Puniceicoccales bacterium]
MSVREIPNYRFEVFVPDEPSAIVCVDPVGKNRPQICVTTAAGKNYLCVKLAEIEVFGEVGSAYALLIPSSHYSLGLLFLNLVADKYRIPNLRVVAEELVLSMKPVEKGPKMHAIPVGSEMGVAGDALPEWINLPPADEEVAIFDCDVTTPDPMYEIVGEPVRLQPGSVVVALDPGGNYGEIVRDTHNNLRICFGTTTMSPNVIAPALFLPNACAQTFKIFTCLFVAQSFLSEEQFIEEKDISGATRSDDGAIILYAEITPLGNPDAELDAEDAAAAFA